MMYPRLKLAKSLLRDDGFIFVSIGDEEFCNMKKLLDEVFGEANYRNMIATRRYDKNLNRQFMDEGLSTLNVGYEFIFVYSKSPDSKLCPVFREADAERSAEGYWKGFWNAADRPTMRYEILGVKPDDGQWKWQESVAREATENYEVYKRDFSATMTIEEYWKSTGESKRFLRREKDGKGKNRGVEHWVAPTDKILRTSNWTDMLASKPCGLPFDSPKNPDVILELAHLAGLSGDDVAVDFFSGSSTTAQSILQLNAVEGQKCRFIMVQIPEPCVEGSDAEKGGYKTICEIARKRIILAGKKIAEENATTAPNLDIGFRVLKLDSWIEFPDGFPWKKETEMGGELNVPQKDNIMCSDGYDGKLTFTSSDENVVKVNAETGAITIVGPGKATITVSGAATDYRNAPASISYQIVIAIPGDVTGDGQINGQDIQALINAIVKESKDPKYDVNEDGDIDGRDIQAIINLIVKGE